MVFGRILFFLIIMFSLIGCVKILYLSLNTDDDRIVIQKEDDIETLIFKERGVNLKLVAGLHVNPYSKQKKGKIIGIDIELLNSEDIRCNFLLSSIVDSSLMKKFPNTKSIVNTDDYYEKNENHNIGLVFQTDFNNNDYFNMPVILKLPEIILIPTNDTILTPEIVISISEEDVFEQ